MMHFLRKSIPQPIKNIYHFLQAAFACVWYGFPAKKLEIIGVTGTDGKTTTANMIAKILEASGNTVALATTINFRMCGEERINDTKYTTLSSFFVQRFLRRAVDSGCKYAVLEVSSHSLDQNRLWGIHFDIAVLTNITREHLDYHKTMERYRKAKRKLFEHADKIILNESLPHIEDFLSISARREITYGIGPKMRNGSEDFVQAENVECRPDGSSFTVGDQRYILHIPGMFNVENALAAICVAKLERVPSSLCAKALAEISGIPGRMEMVSNKCGIRILIDYAVTPEALRKMYSFISEFCKEGKIIAIFGACGERDRGKRPLMGEVVDAYADIIILTNEDPYYEKPERILGDIAKGIAGKKEGETLFTILERKEAIAKGLALAKEGDTVVITGKGAEEAIMVRGKKIPWNEKKIIREVLGEIKNNLEE